VNGGGASNSAVSDAARLILPPPLCGGQIVDRQQADHRDALPLDVGPSFLFLSIDNHKRVADDKSRLPRGGDGFEQRPSARQNIVDDEGAIARVEGAFDEFSQPVILRLLPHDERSPFPLRISGVGEIGDRRRD